MLEPDVGKLASPVLRERGGGNIALLPGRQEVAKHANLQLTHPHDRFIVVQSSCRGGWHIEDLLLSVQSR